MVLANFFLVETCFLVFLSIVESFVHFGLGRYECFEDEDDCLKAIIIIPWRPTFMPLLKALL